jgi:hypothetical protein
VLVIASLLPLAEEVSGAEVPFWREHPALSVILLLMLGFLLAWSFHEEETKPKKSRAPDPSPAPAPPPKPQELRPETPLPAPPPPRLFQVVELEEARICAVCGGRVKRRPHVH